MGPCFSFEKVVGYVTDIEGNLDYWDRYIQMSKVLHIEQDKANPRGRPCIFLKDDCELVYGGDVCDRGKGDITITKELLSLKEKYPSRVHFIMGNRDVNKLRLPFELTDGARSVAPRAFWLKGKDGKEYDYQADKANKVTLIRQPLNEFLRFKYNVLRIYYRTELTR